MLDMARNRRSVVALVFALVLAVSFLACLQTTPALATDGAGLTVGTFDDDAAAEKQAVEPSIVTKKHTMRVHQEATINFAGAKFKSSNKNVATVSKIGLIKAKKKGKATITATNGKITYILKLTVKKSNFKPVPLKKLKRYKYFLKYMSGAQLKKAYKKALKIVLPLGDLSKKEKLIGVTSRLYDLYATGVTYSMTAKHYADPYGFFILKKASCAGCTRATGLCLNILGINYEHVNENQYKHQWARVKVGKKYWVCDSNGMCCSPEPGKRQHPYLV